VRLEGLRLDELLPVTSHYVTYDGSLTQPGCQETVTWLLLNKPFYISERHVRVSASQCLNCREGLKKRGGGFNPQLFSQSPPTPCQIMH